MKKNLSRISNILGTWTSKTHLKSDIGSYELMAYFVIHFMPDPMNAYQCSLESCHEIENNICVMNHPNDDDDGENNNSTMNDFTCEVMDNHIVEWSDVVAFMYFGAKVDVGFPFNKHRQQDTGGWIGPYSIVLAQNDTSNELSFNYQQQQQQKFLSSSNMMDKTLSSSSSFSKKDRQRTRETREITKKDKEKKIDNGSRIMIQQDDDDDEDDNNSSILVDAYYTRYVHSPSTSYLRMPNQCTLFRQEDFIHLMGSHAVDETIKMQSNSFFMNQKNNNKNIVDPFEKYLNTCDNGNVQPLLPLFQFDFITNKKKKKKKKNTMKEEEEEEEEEQLEVRLNYKLLTMPRPKDYMYDLFPYVQKHFNAANLGFHISGPYCYGNDPKRGYTFDMNLDTRTPMDMMDIVHGCIEGLPCLPPAAQLYNYNHPSDIPTVIPSKTTTVNLSMILILVVTIAFGFVIIISLLIMNYILRRRIRILSEMFSRFDEGGPADLSTTSDLFNPVNESDFVDRSNTDLYTPFISTSDDEFDIDTTTTIEKF